MKQGLCGSRAIARHGIGGQQGRPGAEVTEGDDEVAVEK